MHECPGGVGDAGQLTIRLWDDGERVHASDQRIGELGRKDVGCNAQGLDGGLELPAKLSQEVMFVLLEQVPDLCYHCHPTSTRRRYMEQRCNRISEGGRSVSTMKVMSYRYSVPGPGRAHKPRAAYGPPPTPESARSRGNIPVG